MLANCVPGFTPAEFGLHCANAFGPGVRYPVLELPGVGPVAWQDANRGMCGGFVFTAIDLFLHDPPLHPPVGTAQPEEGSALFAYLARRLIDSFGPAYANAAKAVAWIQTPGHDVALSFYGAGIARRVVEQEWPAIKADIDAGVPSPLYLVMAPECGWLDVVGITSALGHGHQVLAHRYELDDAGMLTLGLYDPNAPFDPSSVLRVSIADPAHTLAIEAPGVAAAIGPTFQPIRGFFRAAYSPADPSAALGLAPGSAATGPAAALDSPAAGRKFFTTTLDGRLAERCWTGGAWVWTDHGCPPGARLRTAPGAAMDGAAGISLFAGGADGHLWERWWDGGAGRWQWRDHGRPPLPAALAVLPAWLQPWAPRAHGAATAPGAALDVRATGRKLFFGTGDGRLLERWWDPAVAAWDWTDHGTPPGSAVASPPDGVVRWDSGDVTLFVTGSDGAMWERRWRAAAGAWDWIGHGPPPGTVVVGPPSPALGPPGCPKAFVSGADGSLWERHWDGRAWGWTAHGMPPNARAVSAPGAVLDPVGAPRVHVGGSDGCVHERGWDIAARSWVWRQHGRPPGNDVVGAPGAAHPGEGFFATASDGHVWECSAGPGGGPTGWTDHGLPPAPPGP